MTRSPLGERLTKGLAELVVIVIGVLLALWAEGWREQQVERQRALTYLDELSIEIGTTLDGLEESIELDSATVSRVDEVLAILRRSAAARPEEHPEWLPTITPSSFIPTMPTLTQLVGTTDLRLVESAPLRQRLRETAAETERNATMLASTLEQQLALYRDLMMIIERVWLEFPRSADANLRRAAIFTQVRVEEVRGIPEFSATLSQLGTIANLRLVRKRALRSELGTLAELLQTELGQVQMASEAAGAT